MATAQTSPIATTPHIREQRIIKVPRARAYEAWTNPEVAKQWFGPADRYCSFCSLDVREGGAYRFEVEPKPGIDPANVQGPRLAFAQGVYTEVVPQELLQFTWEPSWNPGESSLVTVTFRDVEGGTEVNVLHERISSDMAPNYTRGWNIALDKQVAVLEA